MIIPHDKFCVLPWVSLEASPVGTVRPCCLADDEILDDHNEKCRLGHMSFESIRNTKHMQRLREQFLNGEKPETCRRCWNEEDAGRTSKRMHTLDRLKHMIDNSEWSMQAKPLMFLDLKLGNICNLKCRICGSWSSSTYASEEIRYQQDKKNNFHYEMIQLGRWPREEQRFWHDLEKNMHELKYLEFTGGEPFMIKEHFDLLDKLVSAGLAPGIEIHYNTNGTIWPEGAEEIWKHFRHVEIAFSIDDVGERFEYQRSNAVWEEVCENIGMFRALREKYGNISLQVCSTVNVLNVFYLWDLARWIDQQDFDFVYWNMLHDSPEMCIANLPDAAKTLIAQHLRQLDFSSHQSEINRVIDFMLSRSGFDGQQLVSKIRELDHRRLQNISIVQPELARILNII